MSRSSQLVKHSSREMLCGVEMKITYKCAWLLRPLSPGHFHRRWGGTHCSSHPTVSSLFPEDGRSTKTPPRIPSQQPFTFLPSKSTTQVISNSTCSSTGHWIFTKEAELISWTVEATWLRGQFNKVTGHCYQATDRWADAPLSLILELQSQKKPENSQGFSCL